MLPMFGVILEGVILEEPGGVAKTVSAQAGSFTFTGTACTLRRSYRVAATAGSFALSGTAASLEIGRKVAAGAASFTFTGTDAGLIIAADPRLDAGAGEFLFTGAAAAVAITARVLGAGAGSFALSGTASSLELGRRVPADAGSFAFSGAAASFLTTRIVSAGAGSFAFSGMVAALERGSRISADAGSFAFSGTAAAFATNRRLTAGGATFVLTGELASVTRSGAFTLSPVTHYIFLVDIEGHDGSTLHNKYLSTEPFTDSQTNRQYDPRIIDPGGFRRNLGLDGSPTAESSPIIVASADPGNGENLDDWLDLGFGRRPITIRTVPRGATQLAAQSQVVTVFSGTVEGVRSSAPLNRLEIDISDRLAMLELPLLGAESDRFAGTTTSAGDSAEGNADLKGQIKQRLWGSVSNVGVQPANPYDLIYLVSNSELSSITLYDKGFGLTNDGDFASLALLRAATIVPGHYATCLAEGLVRVGATPAGELTADVLEGANAAARTAAQIAYRMLIAYGVDVGEIDDATFAALDVKNDAVCYAVTADDRSVLEAACEVLRGIGARLVANRVGLYQVFRIEAASAAEAVLTFDVEIQTRGDNLELIDINVPVWRVVVQYDRVHRVQQGDALVGGVTAERRATVGSEYRTVTAEDTAVLTKHLNAREITIATNIKDGAEAQAEADRLLALLAQELKQYRITLSINDGFAADLGTSIGLVHDRLGMSGGVDAFVFDRSDQFAAQSVALTARV